VQVNRRTVGTVLLALAAPVLSAQMQHESETGLLVHAVRSYRSEQGRTQVDAFVQVPLAMLAPASETQRDLLSYTVTTSVKDSTGLTLLQQNWQSHARATAEPAEGYTVEMVRFSLAPGRYRLEMSVVDSVSGRRANSGTELVGFSAAPTASDLLLSPQIRPVTPTDTTPRSAEMRWGRMLVTAAAQLQLTPLRAEAYYLMEAYAPEERSGTLAIRVTDSTGHVVVRAAPLPVQVGNGGGVLEGRLDLAGLPPARYVMTASLKLGPDSTERSASFVMAGLTETLEKDVARREARRGTDEGYFAAMNAGELEAAKDPLGLIAESGEMSSWDKSMSLTAKRNFLTQFWGRRDPSPGTPRNEAREQFYQKVEFANRNFRRTGQDQAGWKSDRGRIYLRKGAADEVLRRGAESAGGSLQSRALPWEVWHYTTSGKDAFYIFVDRAGSGSYALVHTNDIQESKLANWVEFFGREDLEDIQRFLNTDLFRDTRAY
jgi:GWxTD domain-containing protein